MTIPFPAFCPSCGLIFSSPIAVGNVTGLTLAGVRTNCPRCGGTAELPDGTYDVTEDTIHVLAGSELTRNRMLRLSEILEAARAGEMTDDETIDAVADVSPA